MATRKSRLNTDSPTPSTISDTSGVSLTPTASGRKRPVRKTLNDSKLDDEVKQITEKKAATIEVSSPTRRRPQSKISVKLEPEDNKSPGRTKRISRSTTLSLANTKQQQQPQKKTKSESPLVSAAKQKQSIKARRNSTGLIELDPKRSARLNSDKLRSGRLRKSLVSTEIPEKARKVVRKRLKLNNDKTDMKESSERVTKKAAIKMEKAEVSSDSELLPLVTARRRSDSVSKCSDLTDASSFMDVPLTSLKDNDTAAQETPDSEKIIIKKEPIDDDVDEAKVECAEEEMVDVIGDEEAVPDQDVKVDVVATKPVARKLTKRMLNSRKTKGKQATERKLKKSVRLNARKSTIVKAKAKIQVKLGLKKTVTKQKELIKSVVNNPIVNPVRIETIVKSPKAPPTATVISEPIEVVIPTASQASPPIQEAASIVTTTSAEPSQTKLDDAAGSDHDKKSNEADDNAAELPNINANELYGRSEFLENNLGIEKDPKLVEIVQVHEKSILNEQTESVAEMVQPVIEAEPVAVAQVVEVDDKTNENIEEATVCSTETDANTNESNELEASEISAGDELALEDSFCSDLVEDEAMVDIKVCSEDKIAENEISKITTDTEIIDQNSDDQQVTEMIKMNDDNEHSVNDDIKDVTVSDEVQISADQEQTNMDVEGQNDEVKQEDEEKTNIKEEEDIVDKNEQTEEHTDEAMDINNDDKNDNISEASIETIKQNNDETAEEIVDIISTDAKQEDEVPSMEIDQELMSRSGNESHHEQQQQQQQLNDSIKLPPSDSGEESENKTTILDDFKKPSDDIKIDPILNQPSDDRNESPNQLVSEPPELIKEKESHLLNLGLLTHKAAKMEKQKREDCKKSQKLIAPISGTIAGVAEYTGTLKTVIKLRRPSASITAQTGTVASATATAISTDRGTKKPRESLKMTLHKGRGKGSATSTDKDANISTNGDSDNYYTIHNETDTGTTETNGGHNRKTHNRSYTSEVTINESLEHGGQKSNGAVAAALAETPKLVIPEKASSFRYHPDKECQDQCFYCGGKFGLYDTPCHVAQIKSIERQKNILENEEKLTVDNCLCDACFRHVDRRANCPSYKKRILAQTSAHASGGGGRSEGGGAGGSVPNANQSQDTGDSLSGAENRNGSPDTGTIAAQQSHRTVLCQVSNCTQNGTHSIRRKWYLKMRKAISNLLNLNLNGHAGVLSICDRHYNVISHLMVCALCKRKLVRNHVYYITKETTSLQHLLTLQGVPITIGSSLIVCKLCRYYTNVLLKPTEIKNQKMMFIKNYRRRLLQFHNIETAMDSDTENSHIIPQSQLPPTPQEASPPKQRGRPNKRSRKLSTEPLTATNTGASSSSSSSNNDDNSNSSNEPYPIVNMIISDYEPLQQRPEVSIEPRIMKNSVSITPSATSLLATPPKQTQTKLNDSIQDITILRANPNISMRELFPGEEEMGLQVNIPFNVGGARTPEGWTKVQTVMQYDEPTRRLWEELQKPYGNQSSFMRHLILLEKYYRSGELVLAENAGENASIYSDSVQQRLKSFDGRRRVSVDSSGIYRNIANSQRTQPYTKDKSSKRSVSPVAHSASLLKPDLNNSQRSRGRLSNCQKEFKGGILNTSTPAATVAAPAPAPGAATSKKDPPPSNLENRIIKAAEAMIKTGVKSTKVPTSLPPELICIATGNKAGNSPQLQSSPTPQSSQSVVKPATVDVEPIATAPVATKPAKNLLKPSNVIRLPDVLTLSERLEIKTWRPTLMPVSAGPPALDGQLYQTVDGRKLPNLVQVQSGGKPYLISIHDYNRMCIVRRERLLREQMLQRQQQNQQSAASTSGASTSGSTIAKQQHSTMQQQIQQQIQQAQQQAAQQQMQQQVQQQAQQQIHHMQQQAQQMQHLLNAISITKQSNNDDKSVNVILPNTKVQIPNKILEQNSLIPISSSNSSHSSSSNSNNNNNNNNNNNTSPMAKNNVLDSLLKIRKVSNSNNSTSLLKSNVHNVSKSIEPKIISITSTPSISAILGGDQPITATIVSNQKSQSALDALLKTTQQSAAGNNSMWIYAEALSNSNNSNGSVSVSTNISGGGGGGVGGSATIIDSSAASLLAKIPKSLTVIPQQKGRPSSSKSAGDESGYNN